MSDTARVRAWRQRLKAGGLVPMTIWVPADTKARYEDLALQSHRSVSELAQHALAAYRLDPSLVAAPITDTEQLQGLIRDEIDQAIAIVTATVTATITEAITAALPAMIETALQRYVADTVPETETATPQEPRGLTTAETCVSDMATATATDTTASVPPQGPSASRVADTDTATVTATTTPTAYDPEAAYARMQALQAQGLSLAQIAAQLTAEGVPTRHGRPWHKGTVAYLLKSQGR